MFKLNPAPTFTVDVPLSVPGLRDPLEIQITWRWLSEDAMVKWYERSKKLPVAEALHEVIDSWTGPADDQGQPAPYSRTALQTLLDNYQPAGKELVSTYLAELNKSKRKN